MIENKKNPSILGTNILYLTIALLLITFGRKAQIGEVYTGLLITEYLIILMPILLYIKIRGYSIKEALRLNRISPKQSIYIVFIVMFSYPIAIFFNFIGIMILSKFGLVMPNPVPIPSTPNELLLGFFIIALTPGICEEVMFRGLIMNSYKSLGREKAIIYSAILFGMFHFNMQNLLGPIFLGIIFGIIAIKTDSLFSTILGHTVNNTIALTLGYQLNKLGNLEQDFEGISVVLPENSITYSFITLGVLALVFGFIVNKMIKSLPSIRKDFLEVDSSYHELYYENSIYKEKMSSGERLPIWIFILIFMFWNYNIFFI